MKRIISLSLALILCVTLSVPAFAANYTSYTWSDEYTTMKFDAAAVATETIKAWDYDSEEYTNQNVTMITVKPGSSVTVTGDSMFTLSELTEDGYGEDYMGAEIKTGAVDDIFTKFPAGALFVVEYGKTYIKLGGVDEQPTAPMQPAASAFSDVAAKDWFAESVSWAIEKGITKGTSGTTFSPNDTCTQEQIITFLYRANGMPATGISNPYADVAANAYYYDAVRWGYENGLRKDASFGVGAPCSRSDVVFYLWTLAGKPTPTKAAAFTDVPADASYAQAVAWAVEKGITTGSGNNTFSPNDTCTRAQIVTFLYRAYK